ncbi:hypothetical protein GCM10009863_41880 [Streptomyces axinellae]|uniref:Uncharacterized protein n=1 Tax=Streptomyces axinellae TaxID=552788 RepID=A0ABN3QD01_9ACTN
MPNEYSDEEYAAALNLWNPVDLPDQPDTQWEIGGRLADVPPFGAEPAAALQQHGLPPEQQPDDRWTIPQIQKKTTWRDEDYAAALNAREKGNPPGSTEKQEVMIGERLENVPIGIFLNTLRSKGRVNPLGDVLKEALSKHDLSPQEVNGRWFIPQAGTQIMWKDEHYAAALDARQEGHLPKQGEKEQVEIDGRTADVPIGQFLDTLRRSTRVNTLADVLTKATVPVGAPVASRCKAPSSRSNCPAYAYSRARVPDSQLSSPRNWSAQDGSSSGR